MQTFNQLFFKKKQIFSYFFKEISDFLVVFTNGSFCDYSHLLWFDIAKLQRIFQICKRFCLRREMNGE